jgi:hypothetical protein
MQNSNGINSLKQAREILERHAPKGEHLAYINNEEAGYLKNRGGSGIMTVSGIRSYGFLKKITKPFAKILDKIVPNEIKPALPFIAAALPFLAPGLLSGIGGLFTTNPALQGYIGGSLVNAGTQLAQEGADKRGLNFVSNVLSGIGGAVSTPGVGEEFASMKSFTPGEFKYASSIPTGSLEGGLFPQSSNLYIDAGLTDPNLATTSTLQNLQNTALSVGEKGATIFDKGRAALEEGDIFSKDFLTASVPGQVGAFADKAYVDASNALDKYNKQQISLGEMGVATTEGRKAAIRNAMQLSGYTEPEIESTILKFKFATGGRVGYEAGSNNEGVKTIPINLDTIAKQLFDDKLDNLTYTQKETVYNRYYDLKDKKAEGGIMNLGGKEMDLRAKGGFVPIGKKEKADDVPARLSKNEFVFTARAVRGAGKGDVRKGAKRMYDLMRQYEAMA